MGWKSVKEAYNIKHDVQVTKDGICIGSPYIHNIIVISQDGKIIKEPGRWGSSDKNIIRYLAEMKVDMQRLRFLINMKDEFTRSIPVYTYEDGTIIQCFCEEAGWPNVTHDGRMQYENTFSVDREKVVEWAIADAQARINWLNKEMEIAVAALQNVKDRFSEAEAIYAKAVGNKISIDNRDSNPLLRFTNHYVCPECQHKWQDEWECMVDDDCPACGERHISPTRSEENSQ